MRAALSAVLLTLLLAVPAAAQTPPVPPVPPVPAPEPTIAVGVTAAGVPVGGQTVAQAEQTLATAFGQAAAADVVLSVAGRTFTLPVARLKYAFDANRSARRAFNAGVKAAGKPVDVPLAIEFIRKPIRSFVARAAKAVAVPARNARVKITVRHVYRARGKRGRGLQQKKLNARIEAALADPRRPRVFKPGRVSIKPDVTTREVERANATVITVDRAHFRLRLFKHLKFSRSYPVAVGQPAYPTPTGLYAIQNKQVNPTWTVPNSPWAGELQGQSVSGSDPNNPLKARWMGIVNGVGIHGTGQDYSIGTAASHGCIRMHVSDVIDLYSRTPIGTPVLLH